MIREIKTARTPAKRTKRRPSKPDLPSYGENGLEVWSILNKWVEHGYIQPACNLREVCKACPEPHLTIHYRVTPRGRRFLDAYFAGGEN